MISGRLRDTKLIVDLGAIKHNIHEQQKNHPQQRIKKQCLFVHGAKVYKKAELCYTSPYLTKKTKILLTYAIIRNTHS